VSLNDGGTRVLAGDQIFINVGTHAVIPDIPGLEAAQPLTHIEALELDYLPQHLIVLGGGYVGLEFAQAYRRFGSRVTVIEQGPQLMGREDRDVADEIRGVTVPWPLLASCGVGAWLMVSRLVFGTNGVIADSDHLVGALVITVAVCAMAEVARPLRFINLLFGLWLIAAPWLLVDRPAGAGWNDVASGLIIIALSLPRGRRSAEHYGAWDRYVV